VGHGNDLAQSTALVHSSPRTQNSQLVFWFFRTKKELSARWQMRTERENCEALYSERAQRPARKQTKALLQTTVLQSYYCARREGGDGPSLPKSSSVLSFGDWIRSAARSLPRVSLDEVSHPWVSLVTPRRCFIICSLSFENEVSKAKTKKC
jgi:hypothetical protein